MYKKAIDITMIILFIPYVVMVVAEIVALGFWLMLLNLVKNPLRR